MSTINKLLAALLIVSLLFAGCGRSTTSGSKGSKDVSEKQTVKDKEKDEPKKTDKADSEKPKEPEESKGSTDKEPGSELADFYEAFDSAMKRYERAINTYESPDFTLATSIGFDYLTPTMTILNITQIDFIEMGDNARETGKVGKFDAVRERKGDTITYSLSLTNEEDGFSPDDLKGDVKNTMGALYTKNNTLEQEEIIERDGQVISRTVCEIVMLPDGSYLAQIIQVPKKPADERLEHKGTAYFYYCGKDKLQMIVTRFEPDYTFSYESIIGNPDASLETMAEGYERIREYTIEGDEVDAKKY